MPVYALRGEVTRDGRLLVDLPPGIEAGDATVTLEVAAPRSSDDYAPGDPRGLLALLREWDAEGWRGTGRTRAELDADLNALRNDWDD